MIVVLTAFERLWSLKRTVESLQKCDGFDRTPVYYFWDYAENTEVKDYILSIRRSIDRVFIAARNHGLQLNTLKALTFGLDADSEIVWIQDDMEFSKDFLNFMSYAMDEYRDDKEIIYVSGYSSITHHSLYLTTYTSEALGIWRDKFDVNLLERDWQSIINNKGLMKQYRKYSGDMFIHQLRDAIMDKRDVISVFLNYYMFEQKGYCLHPNRNKLKHLISDSINCRMSLIKRLNQVTLEGFSKRIDSGEWNYKYPKYKKVTRWISQLVK